MSTKPVQIVKIFKKQELFKNGEPASNIEVVNFKSLDDNEFGFNIVSQKNLYQIGDEAIYIQPDYCLPNNKLFSSFTIPYGDPKKTMLGKNNRIRAKKFNFTFKDSIDSIYSVGILLPLKEVEDFLQSDINIHNIENLSEVLNITKYEEPEQSNNLGSGLTLGRKPDWLYATDEENINNIISYIENNIIGKEEICLTIKRDGSSHTSYCKKDIDSKYLPQVTYNKGICSRMLEKKLEQKYTKEYVDSSNNIFTKYYNKETRESGYFNSNLNLFIKEEDIKNNPEYGAIEVEVRDPWVDLANKYNLLEKLEAYCKDNDLELALRGEIIGRGLKGSGTKCNPDINLEPSLVLFSVDDLSSGVAKILPYKNEDSRYDLDIIANTFQIPYVNIVDNFIPNSIKELFDKAQDIFNREKEQGRIIEGVVCRTLYNTKLSCKIMNNEYDSKK